MPDLLAGTTVNALDTPPSVADRQTGLFTFDSTTFGTDNDSGTYIDCAVVFTACTTGRAMVEYHASLDNNTSTASTNVAPYVRTGAVVGSGTDVEVPTLELAVRNIGTDERSYGSHLMLSGLTPGNSYNVRLEHRVSGGIGTVQYRRVAVFPLP